MTKKMKLLCILLAVMTLALAGCVGGDAPQEQATAAPTTQVEQTSSTAVPAEGLAVSSEEALIAEPEAQLAEKYVEPAQVSGAYECKTMDYRYTFLRLVDGTAKITKYTEYESDLVIPSQLLNYSDERNYKATIIGDGAFSNRTNLTSVTIPDSVTSIGKKAFSGCSSKLSIIVGEGSFAEQYCKENKLNYQYR